MLDGSPRMDGSSILALEVNYFSDGILVAHYGLFNAGAQCSGFG